MARLAVFDCDGTLVDSQANICAAMDAAFAQLGLAPPDHHIVRRIVGLSLPAAMARLLPQGSSADHQALAEHYKLAFQQMRASQTISEPLYAGMRDLLDSLHAEGWLLAVATGKSDRGLAHCLASHGIADHFISLQTSDRHPSKPHPAMLIAALADAEVDPADPDAACMIGDTSFDIEMAVAAGVRAIGVNWGYHDGTELLRAGAATVAGSMADLGAAIRSEQA